MRNIDFLVNKNELNFVCFCKIAKMRESVECENACCDDCVIKTVEWLLEDRIMDWRTVKPFTPVKVRDNEDEEWIFGYYFIEKVSIDGKECFIVTDTHNVTDPGIDFVIYNYCMLK